MKQFITIIILCLTTTLAHAQTIVLNEKQQLEVLEEAKNNIRELSAAIVELKELISITKSLKLDKNIVINKYNDYVDNMNYLYKLSFADDWGKETSFKAISKRIKKDGDNLVRTALIIEVVRISRERNIENIYIAEYKKIKNKHINIVWR